uniref:LNS2 domain-containing protein n=1 Tax=Parastrongyloides trichosuri TaxID=131310 RepID=A0A0N5A1E3_PARTI
MNGANLSGAIDVIVVELPDGELVSTPFHVRFGKYGVFYSGDKIIDIKINGIDITTLEMKLTDSGVAYFVNDEENSCSNNKNENIMDVEDGSNKNEMTSNALQNQSIDKIYDNQSNVSQIMETSNIVDSNNTIIDNKTKFLKSLPFNNSIFSMRKYRSLPDLTSLSNLSKERDIDGLNVQNNILDTTNIESYKKYNNNISDIDAGGLSEADVDGIIDNQSLINLNNSYKNGKFRSYGDIAIHRKQSDSRLLHIKPNVNFLRGGDLKKHKEIKWDEHVKTKVENNSKKEKINDGDKNNETDYDGDIEDDDRKQSINANNSINLIGEAALSDSEFDYDGRNKKNLGDVVEHGEWKWGEIPKTKEEEAADKELLRKKKVIEGDNINKKKKQDKRRSGWNFWPFRRDVTADENSDDDNDCVPRRKQDEAITVEDLQAYINNPEKYDKYMGSAKFENKKPKREVLVSATDSGNHSAILSNLTSEVTTPTSIDAMSVNFDSDVGKHLGSLSDGIYDDDIITPTEDNKTIINVDKKKDFSSKQRIPSGTSISSLPDPIIKDDIKEIEINNQGGSSPKRHLSQSLPKDESPLSLRIDIEGSEGTNPLPSSSPTSPPLSPPPESENTSKFKQTLRLTSSQLKSLNLHYGSNEAHFSITTKYQGTSWCSCHIYLYHWYDKLIISDIDGTITKSDILGHVIPAIGGQWAHSGVANLYQRIKNNGYKMIYLSSRAIGQSYTTKNYLKNVNQNSEVLPDGPVLLCPDSIITAFRREVIERRPEEFKIACLSDVKALFPKELESNPFVAGFGNRDTDVKSYLAVGIPHNKILIVNPNGDVKCSDKMGVSFSTNYSTMALETVDYMFPPLINIEENKKLSTCTLSNMDTSDTKNISSKSSTPMQISLPNSPALPHSRSRTTSTNNEFQFDTQNIENRRSSNNYVSPLQTSFSHSTTSSSFTFWRVPPSNNVEIIRNKK